LPRFHYNRKQAENQLLQTVASSSRHPVCSETGHFRARLASAISCNSRSTLGSNFFVFLADIDDPFRFFRQVIHPKQVPERQLCPQAFHTPARQVNAGFFKDRQKGLTTQAHRRTYPGFGQALQGLARRFHIGRFWFPCGVKFCLELCPVPAGEFPMCIDEGEARRWQEEYGGGSHSL
jgi:hypothetical protein